MQQHSSHSKCESLRETRQEGAPFRVIYENADPADARSMTHQKLGIVAPQLTACYLMQVARELRCLRKSYMAQ